LDWHTVITDAPVAGAWPPGTAGQLAIPGSTPQTQGSNARAMSGRLVDRKTIEHIEYGITDLYQAVPHMVHLATNAVSEHQQKQSTTAPTNILFAALKQVCRTTSMIKSISS
jgi:hypothetical protein